jgi:PE family
MSFVIVAPEFIEAAAHDLAGIGSTLGEATASAAAPMTSIAAAGTDEISTAIAALFGSHGQEFQALSTQAAAFHNEFVGMMKSGAGAYLGTEIANAEQTLAGAVHAPAQAMGGGGGAAGALAHVTEAAATVGQTLGGAAQKVGGAVTTLEHGGAASLLTGRIETGVQGVSKALANASNAPAAQGLFSPSNIAAIEAPYKALVTNTETNLQGLMGASAANPHPLLQQIISNQTGYAQTITTALQNAGKDIGTGAAGLRNSFQAAGQALLAGNPSAAANDALLGLENFFLPGFTVPPITGSAPIPITLNGPLGDLLPILGIPGQMAQHFANTVQALTNFSTTIDPNSLGVTFGLPVALLFDVVGSPVNMLAALGSTAHVLTGALQTGNLVGAFDTVLDSPAILANATLNGETLFTLPPVSLDLGGLSLTTSLEIPFGGLLAPLSPLTAEVFGIPLQLEAGTHIGGIIPALTQFLPEQLAQAIAPVTGDV